ncbi:MAG: ATP-binding cassette domain-containing protein [Candidatus Theseobacter exili]|nr:ATP-binding cassette domain-containing protein [Candidatus Theseobacter exili]
MNGTQTILEIDGISKRFHGRGNQESFLVLEDVDIEVKRGKITALIGANGAGKTTLFNVISGFSRPDSGSIMFYDERVNTHNLVSMSPHQIAGLGIGRLFQNLSVFKNMSLIENVLIGSGEKDGEFPFASLLKKSVGVAEQHKVRMAEDIIGKVLGETCTETGLDPGEHQKERWSQKFRFLQPLDRFVSRYERYGDIFDTPLSKIIKNDVFFRDASDFSFGQQRLISLACLFMGDHALLLLDEPTAGVNPQIVEKILTVIRQMVDESGISVFMIEHNMDAVLKIADHCYFMDDGTVTHFGSPADVLGNPKVRREYLGI